LTLNLTLIVAAHEAELGISPRRRGAAVKAERKMKRERAADAYLGRARGG